MVYSILGLGHWRKIVSNEKILSEEVYAGVALFLNYSLAEIDFDYEGLTITERSLVSKELFNEIVDTFCLNDKERSVES